VSDTSTSGATPESTAGPAAAARQQPAPEQPRAEQPPAEQPAPEQPTHEQPTHEQPAVSFPPERTAWIGWIVFAAMMLGLLGIFQLIAGFVALVDDDYFQAVGVEPLFLAVDQTTWGWLQLGLGTAAILTAAGLLYGVLAARVVGIGIVAISGFSHLLAIGSYPLWSVILIAVDVCILYAIAVHGAEMKPHD
jgi:hypothetical protein